MKRALPLLAVVSLTIAPMAPARAQEGVSEAFARGLSPYIARYEQAVRAYNTNPNPESAWYDETPVIESAGLPRTENAADEELLQRFLGAVQRMNEFRGTHRMVENKVGSLEGRAQNERQDLLIRVSMAGLAIQLHQTYERWVEWNGYLRESIREVYGRIAPDVAVPPYLVELQDRVRKQL